jgi:glycosyltransferase involved in cell wall biosynthesis
MRVLHMPVNTSSIAYNTVRALRYFDIDATGIMFATSTVQSFEGLYAVRMGNKQNPHQALLGLLRFGYYLAQYMRQGRPDVIHWYYSGSASTLDADIRILKAINVPGIVEWTGSDIRIPEIEFAENPFYTAVFNNGYEYKRFESLQASHARQDRFARLGFASVAAPGMMQYVQPDIFKHSYQLQQRLMLSDFDPVYPKVDNPKPLIVHSPTARITKGTNAVLKAVESLKADHNFEFRLIEGVPRKKALELMQDADIFLDQFVLGDRGIASLEAMALGKPVICYIKPSLLSAYPADLPIVNATQDMLTEALRGLLANGTRRHELGRLGRAYVENYHDAFKIAPQLIDIYNKVLEMQHSK